MAGAIDFNDPETRKILIGYRQAMTDDAVDRDAVAYLAFLGVRLLRSRGTLAVDEQAADCERTGARQIFMRSFLVAVTNPKGYLFFTAFLPQFIDPSSPQLPQYAALAVTFACIDFVVMFGYASAGAQAMKVLRANGVLWLERVSGGALLALSASLALYRRSDA